MIEQTILIVDDTPLDQEILKGVLEDTYNIALASSGQEALQMFEQATRRWC